MCGRAPDRPDSLQPPQTAASWRGAEPAPEPAGGAAGEPAQAVPGDQATAGEPAHEPARGSSHAAEAGQAAGEAGDPHHGAPETDIALFTAVPAHVVVAGPVRLENVPPAAGAPLPAADSAPAAPTAPATKPLPPPPPDRTALPLTLTEAALAAHDAAAPTGLAAAAAPGLEVPRMDAPPQQHASDSELAATDASWHERLETAQLLAPAMPPPGLEPQVDMPAVQKKPPPPRPEPQEVQAKPGPPPQLATPKEAPPPPRDAQAQPVLQVKPPPLVPSRTPAPLPDTAPDRKPAPLFVKVPPPSTPARASAPTAMATAMRLSLPVGLALRAPPAPVDPLACCDPLADSPATSAAAAPHPAHSVTEIGASPAPLLSTRPEPPHSTAPDGPPTSPPSCGADDIVDL